MRFMLQHRGLFKVPQSKTFTTKVLTGSRSHEENGENLAFVMHTRPVDTYSGKYVLHEFFTSLLGN